MFEHYKAKQPDVTWSSRFFGLSWQANAKIQAVNQWLVQTKANKYASPQIALTELAGEEKSNLPKFLTYYLLYAEVYILNSFQLKAASIDQIKPGSADEKQQPTQVRK